MKKQATSTWIIKKGPSKDDFFQSLYDRGTNDEHRVTFTTEDDHFLSGNISSIEDDDCFGEVYWFTGEFNEMKLCGHYDVEQQTGWIEARTPTSWH